MRATNGRAVSIRRVGEPGDLGWVVMAHGVEYAKEFGWDSTFEALVAKIVSDFGGNPDKGREAGWVAELGGRRVGCIFCVESEEPSTAQLRILLVTADARGLGLGGRLVEQCLSFARAAGYRQVTLWTNDVLAAARHIYEAAGFLLRDQTPHRSFGHDLLGQHWVLNLKGAHLDSQ